MTRARHRWIANCLFCLTFIISTLVVPSSSVRATSLIFAKTTSTTAAPEEVADDGPQTEPTAEGEVEAKNTTKLSGIPQKDYIYDPNLPRELNGYNLSEYPFYETVPPPETMDFKCDGLHDGFYASVPHKCQVYHHCLYGTRYDFLCANYTAFDQKTFICHFVSEVDCKNSANYFNRNEALYKATTSATPPPPPSTTTTTTTTTERPRPPRRRPYHRYDYYDDDYYYPARDDYEYEERGGRRRPRPRPQARPGRKRRPYADEYDDERYERPRPRPRDEPEDYEERRPYDRPRPAKRPAVRPEEEERRPPMRERPRRPYRGRDEEEDERPRPKPRDEDRKDKDKRKEEPKRPERPERPREDRYQDRQRDEGRRYREDRPHRNMEDRPKKPERQYEEEERRPTAPDQPLVKPNGHGIFSQPRMPPKIKRPVPANEKGKYDYVPVTTTRAPPKDQKDEEYYDDYEDDETSRPSSSGKTSTVQRPKLELVEKEKFKPSRPHYSTTVGYKTKKRPIDYEDEYYYDNPPRSQKYASKTRRPADEDYEYEYEEERKPKRPEQKVSVKVVKRPFLPSRGGSPYLPRGLQAIAGKNLSAIPLSTPRTPTVPRFTTTTSTTTTTTQAPTTPFSEAPDDEPAEEYEEEYYDEEDVVEEEPTTTTTTTTTTTEAPSTTTTTEAPTTERATTYETKVITPKAPTTEPKGTPKQVIQKPASKVVPKFRMTEMQEQKAKNLADKVLKVYNDNYERIKGKLETTLTPGDYIKEYLAAENAQPIPEDMRDDTTKTPEIKKPEPEISKPYTATGKPVIPDIKQNLADSIENEFDVTLNEATPAPILTKVPNLRNIPSGFLVPADRDYAFTRYRTNLNYEPQYAASDNYQLRKRPINVSIRTPQSYFIQPTPRLGPGYSDDSVRGQRQLVYRQVSLGNYF